jgi:hypothetical protein
MGSADVAFDEDIWKEHATSGMIVTVLSDQTDG